MTRALRYDVTKCNVVTETLNRSGLLEDARSLLVDIQSAYSDLDADSNFPPLKYVVALLGAINLVLQDQQDSVTLLSRIRLKIISLFCMDSSNEIHYFVQTEEVAGKEGSTQLETLFIKTSGLDNAPLRAVVRRTFLHAAERIACLDVQTQRSTLRLPFALTNALAAGPRRIEVELRPASRQQAACVRH